MFVPLLLAVVGFGSLSLKVDWVRPMLFLFISRWIFCVCYCGSENLRDRRGCGRSVCFILLNSAAFSGDP